MRLLRSLRFQLLVYNFTIRLYQWAIWIASFFQQKAAQFIKGRKSVFQRLKEDVVVNENYIWIHCSSLGEFEQGRPLIEKLGKQFPYYRLVLTFFSPSGYEIRKHYKGVAHIYYLPLDTAANAEAFVNLLNPKMAIFIKYDFWYHYLHALQSRQIPTLLVAAVFRQDHPFFKPSGVIFREMLACFDHIFVQNEQSRQLLKSIEYEQVNVIPDPRIDRVFRMSQEVRDHPVIREFAKGYQIIVGGSTYEEEEDWLYRFYKDSDHDLKMLIAPHEVSKNHLETIKNKFKDQARFYSDISERNLPPHVRVLIIDQVGFLNEIYQYGNLALIGGGFAKSIHNILEPAAFGLPILFGPKYQKFQEAHHLIEKQGALCVETYEAFKSKTKSLLQRDQQKKAGSICKHYIENNTGGTEQVYHFIAQRLTVPQQNFPVA